MSQVQPRHPRSCNSPPPHSGPHFCPPHHPLLILSPHRPIAARACVSETTTIWREGLWELPANLEISSNRPPTDRQNAFRSFRHQAVHRDLPPQGRPVYVCRSSALRSASSVKEGQRVAAGPAMQRVWLGIGGANLHNTWLCWLPAPAEIPRRKNCCTDRLQPRASRRTRRSTTSSSRSAARGTSTPSSSRTPTRPRSSSSRFPRVRTPSLTLPTLPAPSLIHPRSYHLHRWQEEPQGQARGRRINLSTRLTKMDEMR